MGKISKMTKQEALRVIQTTRKRRKSINQFYAPALALNDKGVLILVSNLDNVTGIKRYLFLSSEMEGLFVQMELNGVTQDVVVNELYNKVNAKIDILNK